MLTWSWAAEKSVTPEQEAKQKLAEESLAKMKEWKEPLTQQTIENLVNDVAALVEKEGPACFPKFKGKDSKFLPGTYAFILDEKGLMLMHPILWKMEGNVMTGLRDLKTSIPIIIPLLNIAQTKGSGWYSYAWENSKKRAAMDPITKKERHPIEDKWTFTKMIKHEGKKYIVSAGEFGITVKQ
ncbi:MAG: hypothetical protein A2007_05675 [Verrucomicrobia bacterium GWC2_42_7]|nr:MAG: hypothetical protein A2007_05675 [Verrucomicrobia bacterium GWC2_42_7]